MSKTADQALAFWTAPIGGLVIGLALTWPASCTGIFPQTECKNILGFQALVLSEGESAFLGFCLGLLCWSVIGIYQHWAGQSDAACPDWCITDPQVHVADLPEWEGHVLHRGCTYSTRDRYVEVYAYARPDGTLNTSEPPRVCVESNPDAGMGVEDARLFAGSILKAAGWVRDLAAADAIDGEDRR